MAYPLRRVVRPQTDKLIPSSLSEIAPILRVADEVENGNRRVARLCRLYAFEKAQILDPSSSGHGVHEFKTDLRQRLEREHETTLSEHRKSNVHEMKILHEMEIFYKTFNKDLIYAFQNADKGNEADRIKFSEGHQIAVVLFEVLTDLSLAESVEVPDEIKKAHEKLVEIAEIHGYNILQVDHPETSHDPPSHLDVSSRNHVHRKARMKVAGKAEMFNNNVFPLEAESSDQAHKQMKQANDLKIPLQTIKDCTQDFNENNFIGKGGYGRVYQGILSWGDHVNQLVAVKRLDVTGFQGNKEFHTEVTLLSQYQHENIVTLIGFCDDNDEMILVYEYIRRGSLDTYLRNPVMSDGLSWPQLLKICIGVASALDYLHNHVAEKHRIIHRDIKSANVLLDENWNAKVADFGLARIGLANQQNTFVITNLAGTYGYCDPQYERTGFLTKESDVYSFGVVLFEVLCGRLACVYDYHDERRFLHHLARTCYKNGELDKIIDPRIKKDIKPRTLHKFSAIAYQCLKETRQERPTIAEVALQLKEAMKTQLEEDEFLQD
ncbi:hypothetical protein L2E82_29928 [Cichorium intybus]|uniref:Uncharacterized protein n=1 Tax=Cichorium intybus TaxID=13427 RepID=A0ACB9CZ79_CICIN|nr:hypothetical protein L2E82_29928 [Cichorium intybus]